MSDDEAFSLCVEINGGCRCLLAVRPPCDAILEMLESGVTAADEKKRIEEERSDADLL